MIYSAETRRAWFNLSGNYERMSKDYEKLAITAKDNDERIILLGLGDICETLSTLLMTTVNQLQDLNVLFGALDKLPKGKEIDELKAQIEKMQQNREEITIHIPQHLEKELNEWLKERERAKKAQGEYVT